MLIRGLKFTELKEYKNLTRELFKNNTGELSDEVIKSKPYQRYNELLNKKIKNMRNKFAHSN